ncbi:MAG: hypothetical protein ACPF9D_03305 [Owenweeksia sp.]
MTTEPLYYFMHIPKTAGMTLQSLARWRYPDPRELELVYTQEDVLNGFEDRDELKLVMGHFRWGYHQHSQRPAIYLAFLREPISHVISHYQYTFDHPEKFRNLPEVKNLIEFANCPYGYNLQTRFLSGVNDIKGREMEMLQRAKEHLIKYVEVIGLMERFDESLLLMQKPLGLHRIFYERKNEGKARKRFIPSDEELAQLKEINKYDVELYKFAKQLFEAQLNKNREIPYKTSKFRIMNHWFWKLNPAYTRLKLALGLAKR